MKKTVLIKGAGDLASGIALRLFRSGYGIVMTEIPVPTTVRRTVAFSPAVYLGKTKVEDVEGILCNTYEVVEQTLKNEKIAVIVDEKAEICRKLKPDVVIDAILAKRNLGTEITDADTVIGVGPGFTAGKDCHCVVETKRGHYLGRCIWQGSAIPNTGVPGMIGGYAMERLIKAPADGIFRGTVPIGAVVEAGDIVGYVEDTPVCVQIGGVLRGLLQDGVMVTAGMKTGDVDPRCEVSHCFTVSDKASAIGGGVLEAILHREQMRKKHHRIALVLLAAGDSRRYGTNKLLADIAGKPMYRHLADEIKGLPEETFCRRLVVSQYSQILEELSKNGFEAIENRRSDLGISHSIHLAIQALKKDSTAVCFAVCDQPWLRGSTILKLVQEWSASSKGLGCLSCKGRDGNPAIFDLCYENELLELTADTGGRAVIRRHMDDLYRCEIQDPREMEDVDRPQLL